MTDMIWKARPNTRVPAVEPGEVTYVLSVNNNDASYMPMPDEAWQDFTSRMGLVEGQDGVWRMGKAAAEIKRLRHEAADLGDDAEKLREGIEEVGMFPSLELRVWGLLRALLETSPNDTALGGGLRK